MLLILNRCASFYWSSASLFSCMFLLLRFRSVMPNSVLLTRLCLIDLKIWSIASYLEPALPEYFSARATISSALKDLSAELTYSLYRYRCGLIITFGFPKIGASEGNLCSKLSVIVSYLLGLSFRIDPSSFVRPFFSSLRASFNVGSWFEGCKSQEPTLLKLVTVVLSGFYWASASFLASSSICYLILWRACSFAFLILASFIFSLALSAPPASRFPVLSSLCT